MSVINIHERELRAVPERVGVLIDSLASPGDLLWPAKAWPRIAFDRPLGVGAAGGHGPIRYTVEAYEPGRRIRFRFTAPPGFDGFHQLEAVPRGASAALLRHTIDMNLRGRARLSWPLVYRPLHDALLEDALAAGQAALGEKPDVRPWSAWVRFLRWALSAGRAPGQNVPAARA